MSAPVVSYLSGLYGLQCVGGLCDYPARHSVDAAEIFKRSRLVNDDLKRLLAVPIILVVVWALLWVAEQLSKAGII